MRKSRNFWNLKKVNKQEIELWQKAYAAAYFGITFYNVFILSQGLVEISEDNKD